VIACFFGLLDIACEGDIGKRKIFKW
jgi:hypothetical protein